MQLVCQVKATKKRRTIPVIVRVSDINDYAPVFQGTPYETSISELIPIGSTIFDAIRALDPDAGVNGLAEYFIIPGDNKTLEAANAVDGYTNFEIPIPHQGQVTVNRSLDYERTQKYLDRARDTKRRVSSTTTLNVNVQDGDDQDPSFIYKGCTLHDGVCINPEYNTYVNGGVLAGILTIEPEKIQAVDMDTLNARIKYTIESGEPDSWASYFDIDQSTGAVRQLVPVDISIAKKFQLVIKTYYLAKLTITDRPPVVTSSSDEGQVEENSPNGTKVLDKSGNPIRLTVSDSDLVVAREPTGAASPPYSLSVELLDVNDNAPVIPKTQPITLPASLEPAAVYRLVNSIVRATDSKRLSSQGIIELVVTPGPNTRPPQFSSRDYFAPVFEGAAINSTVTTVTAKDPENEPVTYSIGSGNDLRQFAIGSNTGIITVIRHLDREMIRAEDPGRLTTTATVNIKVTDINDNNPKLDKDSYLFKIKEGVANAEVGQVHATDLDEGVNAMITYSIPSHLPFAIDNYTGVISTKTELDYEDTKEYAFVVTATDGAMDKRLGTASVSVLVLDEPDEPPVFIQGVYSVRVPENAPNYPVIKVHAEDPDTQPEITYTIIKGSTDLFSIDRKTGLIRTLKPLDREESARHELIVGTEENNNDGNGSTATVEVIVDDKNDNAPIFTCVARPVTIEDTSSIGCLVETVVALDSDAISPNNRIRYALAGRGKASIYFHVEPDTEAVKVRDDLRKETDSEYTVDIQAYDQGVFYVRLTSDRDCAIYLNSSLDYETLTEYSLEVQLESIQGLINPESSKAVIKIHVTDVNDNAPIFVFNEQSTVGGAKGKYFAIATKDMPLGTNVLQVKAKDKDSGDFGKIEYRKNSWTKAAEEYFSLDPDTGVISNRKTFENVPKDVLPFKFNVMARDNPKSENYKIARASFVINLLQKDNQLIIEVGNLNVDTMTTQQACSLLASVEERSGLVAGLEKLTPGLYLGENSTLESDPSGTSVWLYLIDPNTGEILTRESQPVKKAVESGVSIRAPLTPPASRRPQLAAAVLATALPAALLALAALVLVAATAATIYICASWNRYKKHKEQAIQQYGTLSMSMAPPRPPSGYESSEEDPAPRFETQVLNMSVDDADLQLDFSERSPTLSETATTARASSINENGGTLNKVHNFDNNDNNATIARNTQTLNRRTNNNHPLNNSLGTLPRVNNSVAGGLLAATLGRKINTGNHKKKQTQPIMAYDEIPGLQRSTDNDNVTFGKRNFTGFSYEQSPVETTTEL
ncbi:unnamed protein product [Danaus chrysippus]|uniref:(African queen) hypothetical protein n=1 Tax=Danaus chrysippus TaxID=151541 RepID=A0A8J2WB78_9NEOP|nr:unnamed protein product [Danaus chrysippus]